MFDIIYIYIYIYIRGPASHRLGSVLNANHSRRRGVALPCVIPSSNPPSLAWACGGGGVVTVGSCDGCPTVATVARCPRGVLRKSTKKRPCIEDLWRILRNRQTPSPAAATLPTNCKPPAAACAHQV